jgi:hypothetical protein
VPIRNASPMVRINQCLLTQLIPYGKIKKEPAGLLRLQKAHSPVRDEKDPEAPTL